LLICRNFKFTARKRKCRLPQYSSVSVEFQSDTFSSGSRTKAEQVQNKPSHCKTTQELNQNENPGALAGATGAETYKKTGGFLSAEYPSTPSHAMAKLKRRHCSTFTPNIARLVEAGGVS